MAFPDIATLLLVTGASNALVACFLWMMHRAKPRARYFHLLSFGAAATALGWGLYATRLWQWPPSVAYVTANLLIASFPALLVFAVRRYLGLGRERLWFWGLLIFMAVLAWSLYAAVGTRLHMLLVATGGNALLFSAVAATLLTQGRPFDLARGTMLVATAASALVLWVRIGSALSLGVAPRSQDPTLVSLSLLIPLLASFMLALAFPVGEFRRDEQRLIAMSERDALTGLPNRSRALQWIAERLRRARPLSLGFIDLDGFKRINDSLGHATGDALLVAIGERLQPLLQPGEMLARFGGDEFLLLVQEPPAAAEERIRTVLCALRQSFEIEHRQVFVSASAGLSAFPDHADSGRELLRLADTALYQAKAHRRGDVCCYTSAMGAAAEAELASELRLRVALEQGRVEIELQPRLDLADRQCHCAEALVRLRGDDRQLVLPGEFIDVAERCGLMPQLGENVLEQACAALVRLREVQPEFRLSVNLSPLELKDEGLAGRVSLALKRHGLPAKALELELTESALIEDPKRAEARLAELRSLGLEIALDDFGAGYSGLSHLLRFPISVLKIDRSFVTHMLDSETAFALVEALVTLSRRLGLRVVAEGIEDSALLDRLAELGCHEAQGYAIAVPLHVDRLLAHLQQAQSPALGPLPSGLVQTEAMR